MIRRGLVDVHTSPHFGGCSPLSQRWTLLCSVLCVQQGFIWVCSQLRLKCCFYPPLVSLLCVACLNSCSLPGICDPTYVFVFCQHLRPTVYISAAQHDAPVYLNADTLARTQKRTHTKQESTIFKHYAEYNLLIICLRLHLATHSYGNFFVEVFCLLLWHSCHYFIWTSILWKVYGDAYGFGCSNFICK